VKRTDFRVSPGFLDERLASFRTWEQNYAAGQQKHAAEKAELIARANPELVNRQDATQEQVRLKGKDRGHDRG